jgi:hypothetical protein
MTNEVKLRITAKDDSAAAFKSAQQGLENLRSGAGGLNNMLQQLGVGLSIAGIVAFAKATIDSLDALNDLSEATGASVENISALEDIAARTGTNFDKVSTSLVKFNAALNAAKPDSPVALAIEAIGLNVAQLKAEDPAGALRLVAVALSGFADDGNKARIVQELFGKSVRDVAPFLNDLAASGKLVATVTTEEAQAAEKFNDQLSVMMKTVEDLARDVAGPLVTSFNKLIDKFKEGQKEGRGFFEIANKTYWGNIREFYGIAEKPTNSGGATGDWGPGAGGGRGSVNPANVRPSLPSSLDVTPKTTGSGSAAKRQTDAERYLETLTKQLEKAQDLSAVQQLGFDILAGRAGTLTTNSQNDLVQLALKIDNIKAENQAEKDLVDTLKLKREATIAEGDAVFQANTEYQALFTRLTANTSAVKFDEQTKGLEVLRTELEAGRMAADQYAEAVSGLFGLVGEDIKKVDNNAQDLAMTFSSAFEDAIVGGNDLSTVLQALEQDILRIMIRKSVTEPLGNWLSSLFKSYDGGGYTGSATRSGGVDGKGGFMAVLHPQETVVDHTKGQGSSPGVTVVQNFTVGDVASVSMVRQAVATSQRQIAGAFSRSQNYGGAVA